jgi:hypothetical protein
MRNAFSACTKKQILKMHLPRTEKFRPPSRPPLPTPFCPFCPPIVTTQVCHLTTPMGATSPPSRCHVTTLSVPRHHPLGATSPPSRCHVTTPPPPLMGATSPPHSWVPRHYPTLGASPFPECAFPAKCVSRHCVRAIAFPPLRSRQNLCRVF